jgi:hypothetical protein
VALGCEAFVTGPMMRIGRAAALGTGLPAARHSGSTPVERLRERARTLECRDEPFDLSVGHPDEMERRRDSPQAMLLIVPNGKVKLLNALPFAPADLRRDSLAQAWQAYRDAWRSPEVVNSLPHAEPIRPAASRECDLADEAALATGCVIAREARSYCTRTRISSSPSGSTTCTAQARHGSKLWMVRRISSGCFGSYRLCPFRAASYGPSVPAASRGPAFHVVGTTA